MGIDFEDFMLRIFNLGKDGLGWSVQDLFEITIEESKQNLATFSVEHIKAKKQQR
jgi:hypothetical protein